MKYFVKKSVLLLLVVLAFCACDPSSILHSKMYFCEDLTAEYRQKFPNEDIHAVVRRLVLSYVSEGDIINE